MQNSLFSQKEFIAASRDFVCVRLESFESKEHQDMVRDLLNGSFANTAFCVFAPDGKTKLTRGARGVTALVGRRAGAASATPVLLQREMEEISKKYSVKGKSLEAVLPDFHSTRQALNVASGDQRLLVLTVAEDEAGRAKAGATLKAVLNADEMTGVFHHDFVDAAGGDAKWADAVSEEKGTSGFMVVRVDEFGMKGEVLAQLPLTAQSDDLKKALMVANKKFAESETRKNYGEHVRQGRRQQIYFKGGMPYGEDRDGDGKIDERRGRRSPPEMGR